MRSLFAWSVHLWTASGAVVGLLALDAVARGDALAALALMALAMAIDSVDGMLARFADVERHAPSVDGALLDNLVDYLNYAVVPAWLIWRFGLVPGAAGATIAAAILLASAYQFAHHDAKTADHFFRGFPSLWNVVAFYMFFLDRSPAANATVLALLCVGAFVPMKFAYPSRMLRLRRTTLALSAAWGASVVAILWQYPDPVPWLLGASLGYPVYYVVLSLWLGAAPAAGAAPADR